MRARVLALAVAAAAHAAVPGSAARAQEPVEYRLLSTTKTSTMEQQLNEAAADGFRVAALMGGETAFGGHELVIVLTRRPGEAGGSGYRYRLLATNRTSTMRAEMQQAAAEGYQYIDQTVTQTFFGGQEVVVVLGRDLDAGPAARDYRLLATSRTSTMQRELQEAGEDGFAIVGMTVGQTAFGAWEIVSILERPSKP